LSLFENTKKFKVVRIYLYHPLQLPENGIPNELKNEIRNEKLFPKGNRSLLRYSRPALEANHPRFAWFNIPGVPGLIHDDGAFWLGTDKVSIDAEKPLNKEDSSILNLSTVIVNDFFKLK
jgi:hypothetical protein